MSRARSPMRPTEAAGILTIVGGTLVAALALAVAAAWLTIDALTALGIG